MYVQPYKMGMTKKSALVSALRNDLDRELFAPDAPLPPEGVLAAQYGVSRHTVRAALEALKHEGRIITRHGVGSFASPKAEPKYTQSFGSIDDLLQYSQDMTQEVLGQSEILVDETQAQNGYGWRAGERWLSLDLLFRSRADGRPLSMARIYTRPFYFEEVAQLMAGQRPLFRLIERKVGGTSEIEQRVSARSASVQEAQCFGLGPHEPMLEIVRLYRDRQGQVYEVSVTAYHSHNFRYVTTILPSTP